MCTNSCRLFQVLHYWCMPSWTLELALSCRGGRRKCAPLQQLQVHLLQQQQAAILAAAAAVRPHALRRYNAPLQLPFQVHLPRPAVPDCMEEAQAVHHLLQTRVSRL